jgi:hypothetical protein
MIRRLMIAVALLVAVVIATSCVPRRAEAVDDLVYIIPAAIGGVVLVVALVAIFMADRDDSELSLIDQRRLLEPEPPNGGIRIGPACQSPAGGMPLLCW